MLYLPTVLVLAAAALAALLAFPVAHSALLGAGGLLAQAIVTVYRRKVANRPVAIRRGTGPGSTPGKTAFDLTESARASTALVSLPEYVTSLQTDGGDEALSVGRVVATLFRRVPALQPFELPFAILFPPTLGPSNLRGFLGYGDIFRMLSSFSPTILSTLKECQGRATGLSPSLRPADAVQAGKLPSYACDLTFPNPFSLSRISAHVAQWPERYPEQPRPAAPPVALDPVLLPDLYFGFAGVGWSSPHQYQVDQVMAALCNRLVDNLTPELMGSYSRSPCSSLNNSTTSSASSSFSKGSIPTDDTLSLGPSIDDSQDSQEADFSPTQHQGTSPSASDLFGLVLEEGGQPLHRFDDFIEALLGAGHKVTCKLVHHAAVFGIGLCAKQPDATFANIPVACFQRTGFMSEDGEEAVLPIHHSAIVFEIHGPLLSCSLEFFHSVNGLVGFHPADGMRCPWNPGRVLRSVSGADALVWAHALTLCVPVLNTYASSCGLPSGGYGLVGVCTDSVALVQHAITGATDEYPCVGRAEHRRVMRRLFCSAADGLRPREAPGLTSLLRKSDRSVLLSLARSLTRLPCDLGGTPANLLDCCRRIRASVPYPPGKEPFQSTVEALAIVAEVEAQEQGPSPFPSD